MTWRGSVFSNEMTGWVGGHGFRMPGVCSQTSSGTTDGGLSWFEATNEVGKNINRFRFTGKEPIVAYASGRTIYQCVAAVSAVEDKGACFERAFLCCNDRERDPVGHPERARDQHACSRGCQATHYFNLE